jgi:hypothetical protein
LKNGALFGIFSCGLLIGTAVYMLIKHMNKDISNGNKGEQFEEESLILSHEKDVESETVNLDEVRTQSASSIYNRHKEAAEIVREAMENINDNPEVISEHKKEFDSILDELDVLSEER